MRRSIEILPTFANLIIGGFDSNHFVVRAVRLSGDFPLKYLKRKRLQDSFTDLHIQKAVLISS